MIVPMENGYGIILMEREKKKAVIDNGERVGIWYQYDNNGEIIFENNYDSERYFEY